VNRSRALAKDRAEVIKIENPVSGDDTRGWGPPFAKPSPEFASAEYQGESAYFLGVPLPEANNAHPRSIGTRSQ
jgi:hypothetical protein